MVVCLIVNTVFALVRPFVQMYYTFYCHLVDRDSQGTLTCLQAFIVKSHYI